MYHIIYLSSAVTFFSKDELKELLVKARKFNLKLNITGILFYNDGNFLQAIEGDKKDVQALFEKIKSDPRHKQIVTLFSESINAREYPEWSMAYRDLHLSKDIHEGYNSLLNKNWLKADLHYYSKKVRAFMSTFIR
jgi:hypothetical protein